MTYPDKPIHFIVSGPAGGPGDITTKLIVPKLSASLGQQVIIENQPNPDTGLQITAKAPPDGYNIIIVGGTHYIKAAVYRKLPYDPIKDFAPVSLVVSGFNILVVHPSVPARSVGEFIAYAKSHPGQLKYASGGYGSPSHCAGELFKIMSGVDMVHVPFNGHRPAGIALSEGREVQLMFDAMLTAIPHIKAGKWRALGVTTPKRAPIMPDVPPIAESGVPGYEVSPAMGVLAPAGTPREIRVLLSKKFAEVLHQPDIKARLQADGGEPVGSTPEEFGAYVDGAFKKWAKLVEEAHIERLESL
jgi:tripartite-type tricarboxylate transporter receptor subunit TctC